MNETAWLNSQERSVPSLAALDEVDCSDYLLNVSKPERYSTNADHPQMPVIGQIECSLPQG
jgi:hypothetical protein